MRHGPFFVDCAPANVTKPREDLVQTKVTVMFPSALKYVAGWAFSSANALPMVTSVTDEPVKMSCMFVQAAALMVHGKVAGSEVQFLNMFIMLVALLVSRTGTVVNEVQPENTLNILVALLVFS